MKNLKIDEKFSISFDGVGATLKFEEIREKTKDGNKEDYTFTDKWYYLNLTQCLNKYKDLVLEDSTDLKEVLLKLENLENLIKNLKL